MGRDERRPRGVRVTSSNHRCQGLVRQRQVLLARITFAGEGRHQRRTQHRDQALLKLGGVHAQTQGGIARNLETNRVVLLLVSKLHALWRPQMDTETALSYRLV